MCDVMETVYFAVSIEMYLADIECLVINVITLFKNTRYFLYCCLCLIFKEFGFFQTI